MHHNPEMQKQIEQTQEWFDVEMRGKKEITPEIRLAICREITKCSHDVTARPVRVALLSLVLAGEVKDPEQFSDDDIQNALWLVKDLRIGFMEQPPICNKYFH